MWGATSSWSDSRGSNGWWCWASFHVLISHSCVFGLVSVHILCACLNWVIWVLLSCTYKALMRCITCNDSPILCDLTFLMVSLDAEKFSVLISPVCSLSVSSKRAWPNPRSQSHTCVFFLALCSFSSCICLIFYMLAQMYFHLQNGNTYRLPDPVKEESTAGGW